MSPKIKTSFIIAVLATTTAISTTAHTTPFDPENFTPTLGEDSVYDASKIFKSITEEEYVANQANKFIFYTADADGNLTASYWSYNTSITAPNSIIKAGQISHTQLDNSTTIDNANGNYFGLSRLGNGGAIYNSGAITNAITGDFIGNYASSTDARGGAIYNSGAITNGIIGDFIGNYTSAAYARGGAIYNAGGTITSIAGDFIGNYAEANTNAFGGAIYNEYSGKITSITSDFIGNYAEANGNGNVNAYGGAIFNEFYSTITSITGDFIGNYTKAASSAYGGAIFNDATGEITLITGNFINNYASDSASALGGAIYNAGTIANGIFGDFIGNYASARDAKGGAIYNESGTIRDITGNFIGNYVNAKGLSAFGGAIYNNRSSAITSITGDFINNYAKANSATRGGAILNEGIITSINSDFINNYAETTFSSASGGAIYNRNGTISDITGDFSNNYAKGEGEYDGIHWGDVQGGAIYNESGIIGNITGDFIGNYAKAKAVSTSTSATVYPLTQGGAIYNDDTIGNIRGDFIGNYAHTETSGASDPYTSLQAYASGGAIYNDYGTISSITGDFINNYAKASSAEASSAGGAIYNNATIGKILNSSFIGNYVKADGDRATAQGGAIYSNRDLLIQSNNGLSEFTGNFVETNGVKESNAIYMAKYGNTSATLNLNAINSGKILFNDGIDGDEGYKIHITGDKTSSVVFNNEIKNAEIITGSEVSIINQPNAVDNNGVVVKVANANLLQHNNSLTINEGTFNILDLGMINLSFNSLKLNGGALNITKVEVDLATSEMGSISSDNITGNSTFIKVESVDIKSDSLDEQTSINFTNDNILKGATSSSITSGLGPVFNYAVDYDPATGDFTFVRREDVNPEVLIPSVAAVAAVSVLSDEIYSRVLSDIDTPCGVAGCSRAVGGAFVKTFGSNDTIDLKNFTGADTKFNGIIGGVESERISEGKGISAIYQAYAAYANGETKFDGEEVDQDAYYLGVGATFYKGNGFLGTTANVATVRNQAQTTSGKDKFSSYLGGAAIKLGYNYDIMGLTVQPSIYGSYTFIDSNNYTTARGARVNFDNSHSMEIAPGLKVAKEFEGILTAYAKARYVHSFNEGQEVHANGFLLPEISLKPYVEYGLGVEKQLDTISGFAEITRRDGGREGWNGLIGLKYMW